MTTPPSYPGTPRWVRLGTKVALSLAALAVVLAVFGGGNHGPWRHFSSGTQPASDTVNAGPGKSPTDPAVGAKE